jgi:hypothetical protein
VKFNGSYPEYRHWQQRGVMPAAKPKAQADPSIIPKLLGKDQAEEPQLTPRELSKEIQRLTRLVAEIEDQVSRHESELKGLEETLANLPPTADVFALTQQYQQLQEVLEGSISSWEEHSARLEKLHAMQG